MNNKTDEIQKQIDTLNHMLLGLQASLHSAKMEDEKERIFYEFDEDTALECISDKVREFTNYGADFEIRTSGKYKDQGFYLGEGISGPPDFGACPWEIVLDDHQAWVLKLKEIQ